MGESWGGLLPLVKKRGEGKQNSFSICKKELK